MSGTGYGQQQGAGYMPSPAPGSQVPQSYQQTRYQPQAYGQPQSYGQSYGQPYGQQQSMPPWLGNIMSMFQRPGMPYQSQQQWSNPYWQPRPVQPPVQQQTMPQGLNIAGQPIQTPAQIIAAREAVKVDQNKANQTIQDMNYNAGGV